MTSLHDCLYGGVCLQLFIHYNAEWKENIGDFGPHELYLVVKLNDQICKKESLINYYPNRSQNMYEYNYDILISHLEPSTIAMIHTIIHYLNFKERSFDITFRLYEYMQKCIVNCKELERIVIYSFSPMLGYKYVRKVKHNKKNIK